MEYRIGEYYQAGQNTAAVAVQHLECVRSGQQAALGCVCSGEGAGYVSEQLLDWFYRQDWDDSGIGGWSLGRRKEREWKRHRQSLADRLSDVRRKCREQLHLVPHAQEVSTGHSDGLAGMLCRGEGILLFGWGRQRIYLCNRLFDRAHICRIHPTEDHFLIECRMEPEIGLLLATESFYEKLTDEMLRGCLAAKELTTTERMERRLRELGDAAEEKGARDMGAILLRTDP